MKKTITIYKITFDTEHCRTLSLCPGEESKNPDILLNGRKRLSNWIAPMVYCPDPEKTVGDFYLLPPSTIVPRSRAYKLLNKTNYYIAEELPLEFNEENVVALNFTANVNCFDKENAEYKTDPLTGKISSIKKYAFHPRRVVYTESTVFKIPEMDGIETFCYEGVRDRDLEFRYRVESKKLQGLLFEKVFEFSSDVLR